MILKCPSNLLISLWFLRWSEDVFNLINLVDKAISLTKLFSNFFSQFNNLNRKQLFKLLPFHISGNLQLLKEFLVSTMSNSLTFYH